MISPAWHKKPRATKRPYLGSNEASDGGDYVLYSTTEVLKRGHNKQRNHPSGYRIFHDRQSFLFAKEVFEFLNHDLAPNFSLLVVLLFTDPEGHERIASQILTRYFHGIPEALQTILESRRRELVISC